MNSRVTNHERSSRWPHRYESKQITSPVLTGSLVAIPFTGIGYRTTSQQGITRSDGEFNYRAGERVTLLIGDVELPSACAGRTVTPYDMGTTRNEPINVVRFLYLLCTEEDGVLSLPAGAAHWTRTPIDFATAPSLFALQTPVAKIIRHTGRNLMDEQTAVERIDTLLARYLYRS